MEQLSFGDVERQGSGSESVWNRVQQRFITYWSSHLKECHGKRQLTVSTEDSRDDVQLKSLIMNIILIIYIILMR